MTAIPKRNTSTRSCNGYVAVTALAVGQSHRLYFILVSGRLPGFYLSSTNINILPQVLRAPVRRWYLGRDDSFGVAGLWRR